ncbi:10689_t:CDS:2 [Acaulospora colombiana]|uniref:10689_t:CDS:1 n=1 Tax=Acaulospora colombiana TaxID=27376 RepID=A0ACA9K2N9_9GLOM|nr:10689_t:CDS:2 [Acaulospora colombiana]
MSSAKRFSFSYERFRCNNALWTRKLPQQANYVLVSENVDGKGIGVVDIGSNGIRFGLVSSLQRHLPTVYEERAPISLFEAQHSSELDSEPTSIPEDIIDDVVNCLQRFKYISKQYGIDDVRVVATEATRIAPNSKDFRDRILKATGWEVEILSEIDEARISGMGVVATYHGVEGLVMDMGGGSVEMNYIIHRPKESGNINMSSSPINIPYGAAALTNRLKREDTPQKRSDLFEKIKGELRENFSKLNPPEEIRRDGGYNVYMCGGGLRSLGYLSMSETEYKMSKKSSNDKAAYPIPIINGYGTPAEELAKIIKRLVPVHDPLVTKDQSVQDIFPKANPFRISKRRAKLIPAACFLLEAVMEVVPLKYVYFCEGGVRQGKCFDLMPEVQRQKDPLETFILSHQFNPRFDVQHLLAIVKSGIPSVFYDVLDYNDSINNSIRKPNRLDRLFPNLLYLAHWSMNLAKESRPIAAFNLPLAGGLLCNAPGLSHIDRAILSWCLMWRYHQDASGSKSGGVENDVSAIDPVLFHNVKKMIPAGKDGRKVCEIIGKLIGFVILCHPGNSLPDTNLSGKAINEYPRVCKLAVKDDGGITTTAKKKRWDIELTVLTKSGEVTDGSLVHLTDNSIVKNACKKLEKTYELTKDNHENGYHLGEINIRLTKTIFSS